MSHEEGFSTNVDQVATGSPAGRVQRPTLGLLTSDFPAQLL